MYIVFALFSFILKNINFFKLLNKTDVCYSILKNRHPYKPRSKIDCFLALLAFILLCMKEVNDSDDMLRAVSNKRNVITIHTDQGDHILWMFGAQNIYNPHDYEWIISNIDSNVRLKDKLSRRHTIWNYSSYHYEKTPRPDNFARSGLNWETVTEHFLNTKANEIVPLMEGEPVTFYTNIAELQEGDLIQWWLEIQHIADVTKQGVTIIDNIIKDRIELDHQTGSLTIKNMRTTDSGRYDSIIKIENKILHKFFSVIVYAPLPVPVITRDSSQHSKCVLLCSVLNVTDVTLSWYKGNSLLSSISESDFNIRLSLPLEVDYQDRNTYSCVLNNPIRYQIQHPNINEVCHKYPGSEAIHLFQRVGVIVQIGIIILGGVMVCLTYIQQLLNTRR